MLGTKQRLIRTIARVLAPASEKRLARNYRRFLSAGASIADVGAHEGLHTVQFLRLAGANGRVAAFEPLPRYFGLLKDEFGRRKNVELYEVALADFVGPSSFTQANGAAAESGLKKRRYNHPELVNPEQISVNVSTLDQLLAGWKRLDYLKIDIEGGELDCLKGGEGLISHCRPIISFECGWDAFEHYGKTVEDFLIYAEQRDLRILDLAGNDVTEPRAWRAALDRAWDFYYVPAERAQALAATLKQ